MADKQIGKVDPTGNYGLGQAEGDKARAWAKANWGREPAESVPSDVPSDVPSMGQNVPNVPNVPPHNGTPEEAARQRERERKAAYRERKKKER
jgi:hypothetical protein